MKEILSDSNNHYLNYQIVNLPQISKSVVVVKLLDFHNGIIIWNEWHFHVMVCDAPKNLQFNRAAIFILIVPENHKLKKSKYFMNLDIDAV